MRHLLALSVFVFASCLGCATTGPLLALGRSAATFSVVADPVLRAKYGAELRSCLARPEDQVDACITHTRKDWAPIREGLAAIRLAWCAFEPWKCAP